MLLKLIGGYIFICAQSYIPNISSLLVKFKKEKGFIMLLQAYVKDELGEFQQNKMLNLASGETFQLREPLGWNNHLKWLVTDYCLSNSKVTKMKSSGHWQNFGLDNLIIAIVFSIFFPKPEVVSKFITENGLTSHLVLLHLDLHYAMHNGGVYCMNRNKIVMQKAFDTAGNSRTLFLGMWNTI